LSTALDKLIAAVFLLELGRVPAASERKYWKPIIEKDGALAFIDHVAASEEAKQIAAQRRIDDEVNGNRYVERRNNLAIVDKHFDTLVFAIECGPIKIGSTRPIADLLPRVIIERLAKSQAVKICDANFLECPPHILIGDLNAIPMARSEENNDKDHLKFVQNLVLVHENFENYVSNLHEFRGHNVPIELLNKNVFDVASNLAPRGLFLAGSTYLLKSTPTARFRYFPTTIFERRISDQERNAPLNRELSQRVMASVIVNHFITAQPALVQAELESWDLLVGSNLGRKYAAISGLIDER
jgi:hypothetical protein